MSRVQAEVESHYRSGLVERIRGQGGVLQQGGTVIRLAKQFGFCYGVERAMTSPMRRARSSLIAAFRSLAKSFTTRK